MPGRDDDRRRRAGRYPRSMSDAATPAEPPADESTTQESSTGAQDVVLFPDNSRRRIPGVLYLVIGVVAGVAWLVRRSQDPILLNVGTGGAAVALIVFGAYCLVTGRSLDVDEEDALAAASRSVSVPIGHASAQRGWRGWLSRPTWRILFYSAEEHPLKRGLVFVDGYDGRVLDVLIEDNPEDWNTR